MPNASSRKEAKELGLKRYFTGKPCKHGHVAERVSSNGKCVDCVKERSWDNRIYQKNRRERLGLVHPNYRKRIEIKERAKSLGLSRFFTGVPCKRGHLSERLVSNGNCLECLKLRDYRKNGPKNPKGEKQWLRKNKALLRGLKRILANPHLDQSNWLNEVLPT